MPELPEVETVRRGLERHVAGRTIDTVRVLHPRAVRRHLAGPEEFCSALAGRGLDSARRRGKYLWMPVGQDALLAHLGMSGQLLVGEPERPVSPHVRIWFTFRDGGPDLRFTDQRTFGHMCVVRDGAELPAPIAHIAPDPFEPAFDPAALARRLRDRRTGLKRALLDQSMISGIGNIYADEALWRARLHWARPTETLNGPEASRLLAAVREVLQEALEAGGTTFDSLYVNVNGESGYFERSLAVYGREGRPCRRCGTPVRRDPFMNRSAYSCPRCQPWYRVRAAPTGERPGRKPRLPVDKVCNPSEWALNLTRKRLGGKLDTVDCARASACVKYVPTLVTQRGGPLAMAKALFGHVGGPDPRMISEMRRLQQRVRDLEAELVRLQEENDALAVEAAHEDMLARDREPALA